MASLRAPHEALQILDPTAEHKFVVPVKRIHDGNDVDFFLASKAYADIITFIFQLNASMFPRTGVDKQQSSNAAKEWIIEDPDVTFPAIVQNLAQLIDNFDGIIDEVPPDQGPRRFGNISFRKWYELVNERVAGLIEQYIPSNISSPNSSADVTAKIELEAYLIGSFGNAQRLDYGTGHELSFLAFLGCLWKLGAFPKSGNGNQERAIVLGVIEPWVLSTNQRKACLCVDMFAVIYGLSDD